MDMSFAVQALGLEYMVKNHSEMKAGVYTAPDSLDIDIARTKLKAMGVTIDDLTDEQRSYITGWQEGT
jgi:adenosylhomocysteinase